MLGSEARDGAPILTPPARAALPPPSRVEAALANLERAGRVRDVVRVAELWASSVDPTPVARLAWARALLALRLVDRAWAQLRVLTEAPHPQIEPFVLTARMFLDRGWPDQARRVLERALAVHPQHPELDPLWQRLDERPAPPDGDGEGLAFEDAVALAERHLAYNNLTRARVILERLRRARPDDARVGDLLWAMDGDFRVEEDLGALVARFGPDPLATLADLPEDPEHTDRTESVAASEILAALAPETDSRAFPQLFRNMEPRTEMGRPAPGREITIVTNVAALRAEPAPASDWSSKGDDTQIVRVVGKAVPVSPLHIASDLDLDEDPVVRAAPKYDLAARREGPEGEDAGVVVVRHHAEPSERETAPVAPEREDLPDEGAAWARKGVRPSLAPTPVQAPSARSSGGPHPGHGMPRQQVPWWLFPFAGLVTIVVVLVLLVALAQVILGFVL